MVFHRTYPPVADVDVPVPEYVLGRAAEPADLPALIDGLTGGAVGYADPDRATRRIAAGLAASGLEASA